MLMVIFDFLRFSSKNPQKYVDATVKKAGRQGFLAALPLHPASCHFMAFLFY
jgi:hypothetical protein